jgi:hypothetical protein
VTLDDKARSALEAVRQKATTIRFDVEQRCGATKARLSVYYRGHGYRGTAQSDEFRLGLAYSEDAAGLRVLQAELEAEERARAAPAAP